MGIHTNLPIYKVTYDLCVLCFDAAKNMPRDAKRLHGEKLHAECLELTVQIFRANAAADKGPHLGKLLERLQVVILLFRLCRDLRFIANNIWAKSVELTDSIGKQANGWKKYAAPPAQ